MAWEIKLFYEKGQACITEQIWSRERTVKTDTRDSYMHTHNERIIKVKDITR